MNRQVMKEAEEAGAELARVEKEWRERKEKEQAEVSIRLIYMINHRIYYNTLEFYVIN